MSRDHLLKVIYGSIYQAVRADKKAAAKLCVCALKLTDFQPSRIAAILCIKFKMSLLLFSAMFLVYACTDIPSIHKDQTYFQAQKIKRFHTNAVDKISQQSPQHFSGVYWPYFFAIEKFPALQYLDDQNQLCFVLLSDSLDAPLGDYVTVTGARFDTLLSLGHSYTQKAAMLRVEKFKIEKITHHFLQRAQRDYVAAKDKLQEKARQEDSKLIWPNQPEWQLFVDARRSKVITYFAAADLMFALDVNLVYDLNDEELLDIYVREWFKGE